MAELVIQPQERLDWHQPAWRWFDNAVAGGRLPQAMLLVGSAGLGKRMFARQLVRHLLVDADDVDPAQRENRMHQLEAGSHADFRQLSPLEGKKGISVDQVRELTAKAMLTSRYGGSRVILVEPAEAMNSAAANALLKCLEEPPIGTVFILLSDQPARLPITIRSRCQTVNFSSPSVAAALEWLSQRGVPQSDAELALALVGNGPFKAAELLKEELVEEFRQLTAALEMLIEAKSNPVSLAGQILTDGRDAEKAALLCDWLSLLVAGLLKSKLSVRSKSGGIALSPALEAFSKAVALSDFFQYLERINAAKLSLAGNANPLLAIESILVPWSRKLRIG
jgi:DNA polymerase-3 subunit delta'